MPKAERIYRDIRKMLSDKPWIRAKVYLNTDNGRTVLSFELHTMDERVQNLQWTDNRIQICRSWEPNGNYLKFRDLCDKAECTHDFDITNVSEIEMRVETVMRIKEQ